MSAFQLRRLDASDAEAFRELRLEGLHNHPEAFGASWEEESERPLAWFAERLAGSVVLAGHADEGRLLGIAAFGIQQSLKTRHKGFLWGMYVRPEARGTGLAAALVEEVLRAARDCVEDVQLAVITSNEKAIRLYSRLGFKEYGLEKRALRVDGRYHDELLMSCSLGDVVSKSRM